MNVIKSAVLIALSWLFIATPALAAEQPRAADHEFNHNLPKNLAGKAVTLKTKEGQSFQAYESGPGAAKGAVLVIHEWWGLNDHIREWTDRLAQQGYRALAVDLYDGKATTNPDEAGKLMQAVDQTAANKKLQAGLDYLKASNSKIATIGWCFGGGQSLQATLLDPQAVSATVIYYGMPVSEVEKLKTLNGPVLGIFAKKDQWITPDKVKVFEETMKKAGKQLEVHMYDADHAFANPSGGRYDSTAAKDAWEKTKAFLAKNLPH